MLDEEEEILSVPDAPEDQAPGANRGTEEANTAERELSVVNSGLSADKLSTLARQNEHNRDQRFKDIFERISIWALYGLALGLGLCAAVWVWHITTPESWRWLNPDRLDKLQDIVTGGLLAGLVVDHFRKRIK